MQQRVTELQVAFSLRYRSLVVEVSDDDDDDERLHYDDASRRARYIVWWCARCWSTTPPPRNSVSQSSSWASSNRCVGWCGSVALKPLYYLLEVVCSEHSRRLCSVASSDHRLVQSPRGAPISLYESCMHLRGTLLASEGSVLLSSAPASDQARAWMESQQVSMTKPHIHSVVPRHRS